MTDQERELLLHMAECVHRLLCLPEADGIALQMRVDLHSLLAPLRELHPHKPPMPLTVIKKVLLEFEGSNAMPGQVAGRVLAALLLAGYIEDRGE